MMDIDNEGRNSDVIISKVKKQYDTARKSVDFKNPDLDSFNTDDSNDFHIGMCVEKHYSAQAFNWPYFSFGDKNNFVYIYNAFNPTFVQRY